MKKKKKKNKNKKSKNKNDSDTDSDDDEVASFVGPDKINPFDPVGRRDPEKELDYGLPGKSGDVKDRIDKVKIKPKKKGKPKRKGKKKRRKKKKKSRCCWDAISVFMVYCSMEKFFFCCICVIELDKCF